MNIKKLTALFLSITAIFTTTACSSYVKAENKMRDNINNAVSEKQTPTPANDNENNNSVGSVSGTLPPDAPQPNPEEKIREYYSIDANGNFVVNQDAMYNIGEVVPFAFAGSKMEYVLNSVNLYKSLSEAGVSDEDLCHYMDFPMLDDNGKMAEGWNFVVLDITVKNVLHWENAIHGDDIAGNANIANEKIEYLSTENQELFHFIQSVYFSNYPKGDKATSRNYYVYQFPNEGENLTFQLGFFINTELFDLKDIFFSVGGTFGSDSVKYIKLV
jgi:hypothetical protein